MEVLGTSNLLTDGQPRVAMRSEREGITQKVELTVSGFPHPLVTTVEHPFWSEDRGTWVRAGSLTVGERLRSDVAGAVSIEALSRVYDDRPVYNIEVTQRHNYYVGDGAVLVHNAAGCAVDVARTTNQRFNTVRVVDDAFSTRFNRARQDAIVSNGEDFSWTALHNMFGEYAVGSPLNAKGFNFPGTSSGPLGRRIEDHFDKASGTIYEINTTPWDYADPAKIRQKLSQIAQDQQLIASGDITRAVWVTTEAVPEGSSLFRALDQAGFTIIHIVFE